MILINIPRGASKVMRVDRDGVAADYPTSMNQGFHIVMSSAQIFFEDEADAAEVARAVLRRLGELT